jgi:hypothetical protein
VTVSLALLILAAVCFAVAAIGVPTGRVHLGWVGLFLLTLMLLLD